MQYPIILGKNLKKGLLTIRNGTAYDLCIVWLKKQYRPGETFDTADINKVQCVLRFCDRASVTETIKILKTILKAMEGAE